MIGSSIKTQTQTIMMVEDSEDDYEATIRAFKKANLLNPVKWFRSGWEAMDHLNKKTEPVPNLILLDLNMPELDGRNTLRLIKEDKLLRQIPVIILTTSSDERDIDACYKMGANTYIQKPVTFDGLIEAVKRLKEYWFGIALLPKEEHNKEE
jgi:two-component system response regulator